MSDVVGTDDEGAGAPADPLGAALAVLREAEATRDEAERYARQRRSDADLLVQKAQRVLLAAEAKASAIVAAARASAPSVLDLDAEAADGATPAGETDLSRLDGMLASAITNAVTDAFPGGATI